jgi:outer membrane biosynthesis protein TonB
MPIELSETETQQFEAMMNGTEMPPEPEPSPQPEPEPKPQPEPKPEVKAEEQPKPQPEPEKAVRLVPHQALHEERERRKALETRIAELEKAAKPQPTGDEMPDETTDPIGTIAWLKAERAKEQKQQEEQRAQHAYLQDLGQKVTARIDAYAKEHPEYKEQVDFLRDFRFRELTEGLGYDPRYAAQQVQQEEIALGKMAIDNDLDPGAMVAKLASVRGWKVKEEAKPDPKPEPTPKPSADEQKLEKITKGQKAAVSPSNAGGGGPEAEMTLQTLLGLQGAAFDAAFAKHGKRLMGG